MNESDVKNAAACFIKYYSLSQRGYSKYKELQLPKRGAGRLRRGAPAARGACGAGRLRRGAPAARGACGAGRLRRGAPAARGACGAVRLRRGAPAARGACGAEGPPFLLQIKKKTI